MAGFCKELEQQMWFATPRGEARAIMMFDYGQEDDLYWLCINQESPHTGSLSMYHNSVVRVLANETMLRGKPDSQVEA